MILHSTKIGSQALGAKNDLTLVQQQAYQLNYFNNIAYLDRVMKSWSFLLFITLFSMSARAEESVLARKWMSNISKLLLRDFKTFNCPSSMTGLPKRTTKDGLGVLFCTDKKTGDLSAVTSSHSGLITSVVHSQKNLSMTCSKESLSQLFDLPSDSVTAPAGSKEALAYADSFPISVGKQKGYAIPLYSCKLGSNDYNETVRIFIDSTLHQDSLKDSSFGSIPFLEKLKGLRWKMTMKQAVKAKECPLIFGTLKAKNATAAAKDSAQFNCFNNEIPFAYTLNFENEKLSEINVMFPLTKEKLATYSEIPNKLSTRSDGPKRKDAETNYFHTSKLEASAAEVKKISFANHKAEVLKRFIEELPRDPAQMRQNETILNRVQQDGYYKVTTASYIWKDPSSKSQGNVFLTDDLILLTITPY